MEDLGALFLGIGIGFVAGAVIGALVMLLRARGNKEAANALAEKDQLLRETEFRATYLEQQFLEVRASADHLATELDTYRERLLQAEKEASAEKSSTSELNKQVQQLLEQQKIWREQEEKDHSILKVLNPVQETLRVMQRKVSDLEEQRSLQHGELSEQLRDARESGERIRATAESLAAALKDNSTRGVWGEVQLRNIVQAAGMVERVDFTLQASGKNADGVAIRPDMLIFLPGDKTIAVDAKVPFNKYLEAQNIPETASSSELGHKKQLLSDHAKALKKHIDDLARKEYWSGQENSPEFTVAFIPSESLISAALEADPALMDYAFEKKVALSSPVTLWSVLKTVAYSWSQDTATKEANQLLALGKELYRRLETVALSVNRLKNSIDSTVKNFNSLAGSLEGRLLVTARRMSSLDEAKNLTELKEIEEDTRPLKSAEFIEFIEQDSPPPLEEADENPDQDS